MCVSNIDVCVSQLLDDVRHRLNKMWLQWKSSSTVDHTTASSGLTVRRDGLHS